MPGRRCAKTGLQLVAEAGEQTFRITKPIYGPLSAPTRSLPQEDDNDPHGRYDASPGRTLYVAQLLDTAFAEVLSPFKRELGAVDPIAKDAAALGMTRDEYLESVQADWDERGFMKMGAIPKKWRDDRSIYNVYGPVANLYGESAGWYIDVEHPDTIGVLERELEHVLAAQGISQLTTAVLRGENRIVTTLIGTHLYRTELDDGTLARGIQFGSKFGGGWCRAIWIPEDDDDTWFVDLIATSGEPILVNDAALRTAAERFRIKVF